MSDRNRRFVVTGIHPVLGHQPGDKFSANLPQEQEDALIAGGGLAYEVDVQDVGKKTDEKDGKP